MIYLKRKIMFYLLFIIFFLIILLITYSTNIYAAYPKLVSKILNGFEIIKTWIIKISTPAAAVAVRHRCIYEKI